MSSTSLVQSITAAENCEAYEDAEVAGCVSVSLEVEPMEPRKEEKVDRESNKDVEEQRKKPYKTPKLTKYGTVEGSTLYPKSDHDAKENFSPVNGRDILARLATIPIETWNYKDQGPTVRHIGPMAQDFAAAFGVGEDDKHINMVDASGVALASIQSLYKLILEKDTEISVLRQHVEELHAANGAVRA